MRAQTWSLVPSPSFEVCRPAVHLRQLVFLIQLVLFLAPSLPLPLPKRHIALLRILPHVFHKYHLAYLPCRWAGWMQNPSPGLPVGRCACCGGRLAQGQMESLCGTTTMAFPGLLEGQRNQPKPHADLFSEVMVKTSFDLLTPDEDSRCHHCCAGT